MERERKSIWFAGDLVCRGRCCLLIADRICLRLQWTAISHFFTDLKCSRNKSRIDFCQPGND